MIQTIIILLKRFKFLCYEDVFVVALTMSKYFVLLELKFLTEKNSL